MKRLVVPGLSIALLVLFAAPALAGSQGGSTGGGSGSGGTGQGGALQLAAFCQNPAANPTPATGSVAPGDPDSCVISVRSGQVASGSRVTITVVAPPIDRFFCSAAATGPAVISGDSCSFTLASTALSGTQLARLDFHVASFAQSGPVRMTATICGSGCQNPGVSVSGPGAMVSATPPPPPQPSPPFVSKFCTGENTGGSVSAGQTDTCSVAASGGSIYTTGESVKVRADAPTGTVTTGCQGIAAAGYQTSGQMDPGGVCRLTVTSGTVNPSDEMGTETIVVAADAAAGTDIQQSASFCTAPGPDGESACLANFSPITISGPGADVSPDPPVSAQGVSVNSTEGAAFSGPVATFSDADPGGTPAMYAATIDWGDGTQSTDGVTGANVSTGTFDVTGSHLYAEEGSYTITVSISDIDTALFNTTTAISTAAIADAPLSASGHNANTLNPFSGTLASFSDGNPAPTLSDFSATIDWGDNSSSSGTITANGAMFDVSGSHTYANLGPYTANVQVCDVGGSCASAAANLLVYGLSEGGNFAIGDGNATSGTAVTFWGSQWATSNSLSGGAAPAAFKGFANNPASAPACGAGWTSGPGDSSVPPATVPTYMAVIVTTTVTSTFPNISGDSAHVVVVKTDAEYSSDPGHPGTGSIVAQLC